MWRANIFPDVILAGVISGNLWHEMRVVRNIEQLGMDIVQGNFLPAESIRQETSCLSCRPALISTFLICRVNGTFGNESHQYLWV